METFDRSNQMSQAQEERRARMWEKVHKESHEREMAELQAMKAQLDAMDPNSEEYKNLKAVYDSKYQSALEFFMKYHE